MPRRSSKTPTRLSECNHGDRVRVKRWYRVTLNPLGLRKCKPDGTEDNSSTGWMPEPDWEVIEHKPAQASVDEGVVEDPLA